VQIQLNVRRELTDRTVHKIVAPLKGKEFVMKHSLSALLVAVFVLFGSFASAQDKSVTADSKRKLAALFSALSGEKTCSKISDDSETWECTYRGQGLRHISVRAAAVRGDIINADIVMVMSLFATRTEFPNTTEFLNRLLKFNGDIDFAKLAILDDGRIVLLAACPIRLLDKEELVLLLDQVAAANNAAFDAFGKDAEK